MEQPYLLKTRICSSHAIENNQDIVSRRICDLACESLHLRWLVRVRRIAACINVRPVSDIRDFHVAGGPQVTCSFKIFPAPHRVPVARRIHALAAVISSRPQILGAENLLARLINKHRVMRDRSPVVVQIVRTLRIGVVSATLSCQIALVINDEMVLVEMIVLCEIRTGVELYPRRIRTKSIAHDQVTNAAKQMRARNLRGRAVGGIARRYIRIVPQKLRYRDAPFWLRGPAALAQKPCCIRILEAIDRISKTDIVFPLEVRKLVIVVASSRTVGQNFVKIRVGVMLEERITQRWIAVRCRS